jgi:hypothetical protein
MGVDSVKKPQIFYENTATSWGEKYWWSVQNEEGAIRGHPAMVAATSRLAGVFPPGTTVVVPERHTAFMATFSNCLSRCQPPSENGTRRGACNRPELEYRQPLPLPMV